MSSVTTIAGNAAYLVKNLYSPDQAADAAIVENPVMAMLEKKGGWTGNGHFLYALDTGDPQGGSGTFANAKANASSLTGVQFDARRRKTYWYNTIDGESIAACGDDKGAFGDLFVKSMNKSLRAYGTELEFQMHRDGTGMRGRRLSATGNVLTLNAGEVRAFFVNMYISASAAADGTGLRAGKCQVTAVDEDNNKITVDNVANITGFVNNDYLYRSGMETATYCADGFESHIPLTAPTAGDSFRGIDRSVDVRRMAGSRQVATGSAIEEDIGGLLTKIGEISPTSTKRLCYLPHTKLWEVVRRQNAKVVYDGGGSGFAIGAPSADVITPAGMVKLVGARLCPDNRFRIIDPSTWFYKNLKGLTHVIDDDGKDVCRQTDDDGLEVRFRNMGNSVCVNPASNGTGEIATS